MDTPEKLKKMVGGDVIHLRTTDNELAIWKLRETLSLEAKDQNGSLYITTRGGDKLIPGIIRTLEDIVVTVSLERPSINDVFLKLTGKDIREAGASRRDDIPSGLRSARRRKER